MELEEIENTITARGLIYGASKIDPDDQRDEELTTKIAAVASQRNRLLSEQDIELLDNLPPSEFFNVQIFLCEVIPHLKITPEEMMNLIRILVEKGGEDLAANQPHAAFRKWCASDTRGADEVIASARAGNLLSLQYLVFALEGKGDVEEAFRSATTGGEEKFAGILALSRMSLSQDEAARAIEFILEVARSSETKEAARSLKAALDIAGKHPGLARDGLAEALREMSGNQEPIAVHLMATALHWHLREMTSAEVESCLDGIVMVDPQNKGTIREIDLALRRLWETHPLRTGKTVAELIARSEGRVSRNELPGFFSATEGGDRHNLAKLVTEWLLAGDYHVCSVLTSQLSEINRKTPCVEVHPDDLPPSPDDQVFICRKAIGFLFLSPMSAASWIVAVLRRGDPEAARSVAGLLLDPLLLNYGGALRDWLEEVAQADAPGSDVIRDALQQAQTVWDGIAAAREVVELEPPASHRALVRFQEAEEAARMQEVAQGKSLLAQLMTTQTLLYGDQSSFSIRDDDGSRRSQTVPMAQIAVSSELPKGIFFDPVGTDWLLEVFRHEQRKAA